LTRTWAWLSARIASALPTTLSLTNAQKSAVQATPSSVGYNGLMDLTKMMMRAMKVTMRSQMRMMTVLMNLCGEKQLQASPKANATQLNVQNAV